MWELFRGEMEFHPDTAVQRICGQLLLALVDDVCIAAVASSVSPMGGNAAPSGGGEGHQDERNAAETAGGVSLFQLLNAQTDSAAQFYAALQTLRSKRLVDITGDIIRLSVPIDPAAAQLLAPLSAARTRCVNCDGTGVDITPPPTDGLTRSFEACLSHRPPVSLEFDQGFLATPDAIRKVILMHRRGDVMGKSILLIGDDDFLGVLLALTRLPKRVLVLEIDGRLTDEMMAVKARLGLDSLQVRKYDVCDPFPEDLTRAFDTFMCDPMDTRLSFRLFLSRGVRSLRGAGSAMVFGLTNISANKSKWLDVQNMVAAMGFALTDIIRDFHSYANTAADDSMFLSSLTHSAPSVAFWYRSSLLRAECVRYPPDAALPFPAGPYDGPMRDLYLDDDTWAVPCSPDDEASLRGRTDAVDL
jgi:N4-bis(aminopropyl)spermidine synthase